MSDQQSLLSEENPEVLARIAAIDRAVKSAMRSFLGQTLTTENGPVIRASLVESIRCVSIGPFVVDLDE